MTLPPAHDAQDALSEIDNLVTKIRRAAFDAAPVGKLQFSQAEVAALLGLQNNLGAALDAFLAEMATAPRQ
jgi:hypothetical protein